MSTSSLLGIPNADASKPSSQLSAAATTSSLISMSGLNLGSSDTVSMSGLKLGNSNSVSMSGLNLGGTDSVMSDTSRLEMPDAGRYDFSSVKSELNRSAVGFQNSPVPGSVMSEASQFSASDLVRFTTGHSMDFMTRDSSAGGSTAVRPFLSDQLRAEDWMSKSMDWKCEKDEMMMKIAVKGEEPMMSSVLDPKTSAAAVTSPEIADTKVSDDLKTDPDKPGTTVDAVATSNMTSSSSSAAVTTSSAMAGSEMTAVMSASDMKKESQAINYDWVSAFDYTHY